jgi:hypothetical protein
MENMDTQLRTVLLCTLIEINKHLLEKIIFILPIRIDKFFKDKTYQIGMLYIKEE